MTPVNPAVVIGASGFIGRHLVRALLALGRPVIGVCRRPEQLSDLRHSDLTVVQGDIERPETFHAFLRRDATLIQLAGMRPIIGIPPARFEQLNVASAVALGRAAVTAGVARFVYVSTALIFGPADGDPVDEQRVYLPAATASAYVRSRVRAATEMQRLAGEGLPLVTVCPAIVFGSDEATHPNRLAVQARRVLASGVDLVIGGGRQRRTLVFVDDVVRGILQAEERGTVGAAYILGGEDCSHREFSQAVLELAGRPRRLRVSIPPAAARGAARLADRLRGYDPSSGYAATVAVLTSAWRFRSDKAARQLGYRATPLRDGIRRMLEPSGGRSCVR